MPSEPTDQTHLSTSRELIDLARRLTQEQAELRAYSLVLRQESRQLREDSQILRRLSTRLPWRKTP